MILCKFIEGYTYEIHLTMSRISIQGDVLYMFFETKNPITMQGDIGAARSIDNGASWQQLGVVLDEEWHLSYPFVFNYDGQVRSLSRMKF
ncbi:putative glycosyl hydrolase, five-bladed beta-propellor domain superfamily [Helianthus annuus]|nr:putative glycosyl hydrolase, five-bladed beta-propellor domain superfamily [Helianthus annuus]